MSNNKVRLVIFFLAAFIAPLAPAQADVDAEYVSACIKSMKGFFGPEGDSMICGCTSKEARTRGATDADFKKMVELYKTPDAKATDPNFIGAFDTCMKGVFKEMNQVAKDERLKERAKEPVKIYDYKWTAWVISTPGGASPEDIRLPDNQPASFKLADDVQCTIGETVVSDTVVEAKKMKKATRGISCANALVVARGETSGPAEFGCVGEYGKKIFDIQRAKGEKIASIAAVCEGKELGVAAAAKTTKSPCQLTSEYYELTTGTMYGVADNREDMKATDRSACEDKCKKEIASRIASLPSRYHLETRCYFQDEVIQRDAANPR